MLIKQKGKQMKFKQAPQIGQLYTNVLSTKHHTVKVLDHKNGHVLVQPTTGARTYWVDESTIHRNYELTKELDYRGDDLYPETWSGMQLIARRSDALLEVVEIDKDAVIAKFIKTNSRQYKPGDYTTMTIASLHKNYTVQLSQ